MLQRLKETQESWCQQMAHYKDICHSEIKGREDWMWERTSEE